MRRLIAFALAFVLLAVPTASVAQIDYPPRAPVGALVKRVADDVGRDFTGGVSIIWDTEVYDSAAFHDNVTNNTRITIPAGVNRVQCGATVTLANNTIGADMTLIIRKNGATSYDGVGQFSVDAPTTSPAMNISTAPVDVVAGDFFETTLFNVGDAAIDTTAARSSFWCQVLG